MACIGEPISWPRLEQFARAPVDPAIAAHLAACPVCQHCLDQLRADVVELPPLVVLPPLVAPPHGRDAAARPLDAVALAAPPTSRPRIRRWLAPVVVAAAAAVVSILVLRRPAPTPGRDGDGFLAPIGVKGIGDVRLELVRERGGAITRDARRYAPGDRWKVVVTCPPRATEVAIDISVADGVTTDHPLAATQIACGNQIIVPGAFTITGARPNRVCATVASAPGAEASTACATLRPESLANGR